MASLKACTVGLVVILALFGDKMSAFGEKTKEQCIQDFIIMVDATRSEENACPAGEKLYFCLLDVYGFIPGEAVLTELETTIQESLSTYFGIQCTYDFEKLLREYGNRPGINSAPAVPVTTWWKIMAAVSSISMATLLRSL